MSQFGAFDVFLTPEAAQINAARLEHLVSLGLDLAGKRVLEVGGGIGLLTQPFEDAGCRILSTDGAPANIAEMRRRYPHRQCMALDIDATGDFSALGRFDIVFCYGTLYHLAEPERALAQLAAICDGQIVLETIVLPGDGDFIQLVSEPPLANQAVGGVGCRPSRGWVMSKLQLLFGHAYATLDQPDFPDFVKDWRLIEHAGNLRAVFVGSRSPLDNPNLTSRLPERHRDRSRRRGGRRRVWIEAGTDSGLDAARQDDGIEVHVFEPRSDAAAALASVAPPNCQVHAGAIALTDGVAPGVPGEATLVQTFRLDSVLGRIGAAKLERLRIGADHAVVRSLGDRVRDVRRIEFTGDAGAQDGAELGAATTWLTRQGFKPLEPAASEAAPSTELVFVQAGSGTGLEGEVVEFDRLYDLSRLAARHGRVTATGGEYVVTTATLPWAYAAAVDPGPAMAGDTRAIVLRLWAEAEDGSIEIGVADTSGQQFLARATIAPGPGQIISLTLPAGIALGQFIVRNAADRGPARVRLRPIEAELVSEAESDAHFGYDERRDFETIPAGWEDPFALLRAKWSEIPASYEERRQSGGLMDLTDQALLAYWRKSFEEQTIGDGYNIRGWYHDLYRSVVPGLRILDVGCGIGTSSIFFAELGAKLVFADIVESNVRLVERLCRLKGIDAEFYVIEDYAAYDRLPHDLDMIMAIGSLINAPHGVTRREIARLVPHLKPGGRWLHLAYPRARWEREGRTPFSRWGEITDGVGTPWMVYQNRAEIEALFAPTPIRILFDCEWRDSEFNWFDLEVGQAATP